MKNKLFPAAALLLMCGTAVIASCKSIPSDSRVCSEMKPMIRESIDDTLIPVRQGGVNRRPFWNTYANRFIYVPAFEFAKESAAVSYRFTAEDRFGVRHTFSADRPVTSDWINCMFGSTNALALLAKYDAVK